MSNLHPHIPCITCNGYIVFSHPYRERPFPIRPFIPRAIPYGFPQCTCMQPYVSDTRPASNGHLRQIPEDRIPVIIQFNMPALLKKFPGLHRASWENHPYLAELRQNYNNWFNLLLEKAPSLNISDVYTLLTSGVAATLSKEEIEKLRSLSFIKGIYPDEDVMLDHKGEGEYSSAQLTPITNQNEYNLDIIGISEVRKMMDTAENPLDGRGIRVAVIDHGFNVSQLPEGSVIDQYDFVNKSNTLEKSIGNHGTIVTQVILDTAPNTLILAYSAKKYSQILSALEESQKQQARIINLSLGFPKHTSGIDVYEAPDTAALNGAVVVNSSGNQHRRDEVGGIGTSKRVLSVGATNKQGDQIADFSNYNSRLKPDVVAPGYYELNPQKIIHGTSISAPYVSGSVALLLQKYPEWTPAQVMSALATTATSIQERDPYAQGSQGSGRINIAKAIQADTFLSPTHITVPIYPNKTSHYVLHIENENKHDQTYQLRWDGSDLPRGTSISLPQEITVPARTTSKVSFSIRHSAAILPNPAYIGKIYLTTPSLEQHIPVLLPALIFLFLGGPVDPIALSSNARFIASRPTGNRQTQLWDLSVSTTAPIRSFDAGSLTQLSVSPNGQFIASVSHNTVKIWDLQSDNTTLFRSFIADGRINSISFSPNSRLIALGLHNGYLQVWDLHSDSRTPTRTFNTGDAVLSVTFDPKEQFVASGSRTAKNVQVWDLNTNNISPSRSFNTGSVLITSISFSRTGRFLASASSEKIDVWDLHSDSNTPVRSFTTIATFVSFSPNERFIASGAGRNIQVWSLSKASLIRSIKADSVKGGVLFSPAGNVIVSGANDKVQIWNPELP